MITLARHAAHRLLMASAFVVLQRQGRCIDTYQAIWGPGSGTAASRKRPVGWGIRRYTAAQWQRKFGQRHTPGRTPQR